MGVTAPVWRSVDRFDAWSGASVPEADEAHVAEDPEAGVTEEGD